MFQVGFGLNAFQSGLLMLGLFLGNLGMKTFTTPVLRRFGFRSVLLTNGLLTAVTILACAALTAHTPRALIISVLFLHGVSRSMQFTSLTTLAFCRYSKALSLSSATTFFSMVTQMSMGMGVAVGAVALRLAALLSRNLGVTPTVTDFHIAFVLIALMALIAVVDCVTLDANAGAEVSGHRASTYAEDQTVKSLESPSPPIKLFKRKILVRN